MNAYMLLLPVFLLCLAGAGLSYTDSLRQSRWYIPWMVFLGAACAGLFAWAAVILDSSEKIYTFSLLYDSVMALCYYLIPLAILGVSVPPTVLVGATFVVLGLLVVKLGS